MSTAIVGGCVLGETVSGGIRWEGAERVMLAVVDGRLAARERFDVCEERERRTGQFQNGEDELVMQFVSASRVEVGSCYLAC